jgi:hypothetical protein
MITCADKLQDNVRYYWCCGLFNYYSDLKSRVTIDLYGSMRPERLPYLDKNVLFDSQKEAIRIAATLDRETYDVYVCVKDECGIVCLPCNNIKEKK